MHKIFEKDKKIMPSLLNKVTVNSISDKLPLYWTNSRKGTVSQFVKMTRCIVKSLHICAYKQPSLILMFISFDIVTNNAFQRTFNAKKSVLMHSFPLRRLYPFGVVTLFISVSAPFLALLQFSIFFVFLEPIRFSYSLAYEVIKLFHTQVNGA